MQLKNPFKYCPSCKSTNTSFDDSKKYFCCECGFEYYQNTAAAVAGILEFEGKVLTVRRNRDPGKGKLDFPGGFVDPGEDLEAALIREIREELQTDIFDIEYLCSATNLYEYKGITYSTCDAFFTAKILSANFIPEKAEISEIIFFEAKKLNPTDFAFGSMTTGINHYLEKQKNRKD